MGEVYLAQDTRLQRRVALKLLPATRALDQDAGRRLLREARAAAALEHPNICAIYEVGDVGGRGFIAMQYVEGETLAARLAAGRPSLRESLDLATQVADALAAAHAHQVIHRDVKPANVVVATRGQVKVLDFGLARIDSDPEPTAVQTATASLLTTPGMVMGTVPYMSPEQLRGEGLDRRTDIFSFGALLYEMLSGRPPFAAASHAEVVAAILTREPPQLPDLHDPLASSLARLAHRCLQKVPDRRYQDMNEVADELRQLAVRTPTPLPAPAGATRTTERLPATRSAGRKPWLRALRSPWVVASGVLLAAAATAAIVGAVRTDPPKEARRGEEPADRDAYDDYLRGKVLAGSQNKDDIESAIALLQRAVAATPQFAPAWAELARAYNLDAFYLAPEADRRQISLNAEVAVERALALDPNLAAAQYARGLVLWTHAKRFPHEQAIRAFERALALDPQMDDAHHQLGVVYLHIGLLDRARAEIDKALAINPGNTMALFRLGIVDVYRGEYEAAVSVFRSVPLQANPSLVGRGLATALFQLGRVADASALVEQYLASNVRDEGGSATAMRAMLQARAGERLAAHESIRQATEIGKGFGHFHHTAYSIASAYALLAEPKEAVTWLAAAAEDGFPCYPLFASDPNLSSLRQDPRYVALLAALRKDWQHYQDTL